MNRVTALAASLLLALPTSTWAQGAYNPAPVLEAQRVGMQALASMDGVWRGPAWTVTPAGEKHTITQTERIGPFLEGTVKVVEGRGYNSDGSIGFNALGIISYDPTKKAYNLRSYAQGRSGDFVLTPTADGYIWEIPAGPMTIRYTAVIKDGTLREIGERIAPGAPPVLFFEMNLRRVSDSAWPGDGAIPLK